MARDHAVGDTTVQTLAEIVRGTPLAGRRDAATLDRIKFWDAGPAPFRWTETLTEWAMPPDLRTGLANGAGS